MTTLTEIHPDSIAREKVIGQGAFSNVFKGSWEGRTVAIKELRLIEDKEGLLEEAKLLSTLEHENVVRFYGVIKDTTDFVLEFFSDGSLFASIKNQTIKTWEKAKKIKICKDICSGVAYLHSKGVIHRDLKSPNVLIEGDRAAITDFGIAKIVHELSATQTRGIGSIAWMAPEQMDENRYDQRADLYALGLVIWEVFEERVPFADQTPTQIIYRKLGQKMGEEIDRRKIPGVLAEILEKCWADPIERPTPLKILEALDQIGAAAEETSVSLDPNDPNLPLLKEAKVTIESDSPPFEKTKALFDKLFSEPVDFCGFVQMKLALQCLSFCKHEELSDWVENHLVLQTYLKGIDACLRGPGLIRHKEPYTYEIGALAKWISSPTTIRTIREKLENGLTFDPNQYSSGKRVNALHCLAIFCGYHQPPVSTLLKLVDLLSDKSSNELTDNTPYLLASISKKWGLQEEVIQSITTKLLADETESGFRGKLARTLEMISKEQKLSAESLTQVIKAYLKGELSGSWGFDWFLSILRENAKLQDEFAPELSEYLDSLAKGADPKSALEVLVAMGTHLKLPEAHLQFVISSFSETLSENQNEKDRAKAATDFVKIAKMNPLSKDNLTLIFDAAIYDPSWEVQKAALEAIQALCEVQHLEYEDFAPLEEIVRARVERIGDTHAETLQLARTFKVFAEIGKKQKIPILSLIHFLNRYITDEILFVFGEICDKQDLPNQFWPCISQRLNPSTALTLAKCAEHYEIKESDLLKIGDLLLDENSLQFDVNTLKYGIENCCFALQKIAEFRDIPEKTILSLTSCLSKYINDTSREQSKQERTLEALFKTLGAIGKKQPLPEDTRAQLFELASSETTHAGAVFALSEASEKNPLSRDQIGQVVEKAIDQVAPYPSVNPWTKLIHVADDSKGEITERAIKGLTRSKKELRLNAIESLRGLHSKEMPEKPLLALVNQVNVEVESHNRYVLLGLLEEKTKIQTFPEKAISGLVDFALTTQDSFHESRAKDLLGILSKKQELPLKDLTSTTSNKVKSILEYLSIQNLLRAVFVKIPTHFKPRGFGVQQQEPELWEIPLQVLLEKCFEVHLPISIQKGQLRVHEGEIEHTYPIREREEKVFIRLVKKYSLFGEIISPSK